MKTPFYYLTLLLFPLSGLLTSCGNDDPTPPSPVAEIVLSKSTLNFGYEGSEQTIRVNTDAEWMASLETNVDWVTFTPDYFNGTSDVTVTVNPYSGTTDDRSVRIKFESLDDVDMVKYLTVNQSLNDSFLDIETKELPTDAFAEAHTIDISTSYSELDVEVTQGSAWCDAVINNADGRMTVVINVEDNLTESPREARVIVSADGKSEQILVKQEAYDAVNFFKDGEYFMLNEATIGAGVPIVIIGDGYKATAMSRENGLYLDDMQRTMDNFFSVAPFDTHKEYFDVYVIAAISKDEGISPSSTNRKNTALGTYLADPGNSSAIDGNATKIWSLVNSIPGLEALRREMTIIVPINSDIRAGTSKVGTTNAAGTQSTFESISYCPTANNAAMFRSIVMHEAGGHGFARLIDEYVYPGMEDANINNSADYGLQEGLPEYIGGIQSGVDNQGFAYRNVTFTSNVNATRWRLFNIPKYTTDAPELNRVGTFEGAYYFGKGIWRPEVHTCMDGDEYPIAYHSAYARWLAVERIMRVAGIEYTLEQFLVDDVIPTHPDSATNAVPAMLRARSLDHVPPVLY